MREPFDEEDFNRALESATQAPRAEQAGEDVEVTADEVMETRELVQEHPVLRGVYLPKE